jgi:mannobiose 2-epimerase
LFFDEKWILKSDKFSYGHDVEGGWLLHEAAEILNNEEIFQKVRSKAVTMTDAALEGGLDVDGGLMYEGDDNGIIDRDKHWWPQAEALVGLVNAFQISGDPKYMDKAKSVWAFINEKIVDHENGEWYWSYKADGSINKLDDKAGPWKCPYHNGRAMLELMRRLK